jgi:hypothetical protein
LFTPLQRQQLEEQARIEAVSTLLATVLSPTALEQEEAANAAAIRQRAALDAVAEELGRMKAALQVRYPIILRIYIYIIQSSGKSLC